MKIYISADIEGMWGIVSRDQVSNEEKDYGRARKLMTQEVNWVVEELLQAGATKIVVNDSHGSMDNILIEELNPNVELISGSAKPLSMMEGINNEFDGVMLIGYHPRAGTSAGIFDHTYAGKIISNVQINGKAVGEAGLNAGVAGYFKVPVVLVSGDDKLAEQVKLEVGDVESVIVKHTVSRYAAHNLSMIEVKEKYKEATQRAIENMNDSKPVTYEGEIEFEIEFNQAVMADVAMQIPGVIRRSPKSVAIRTEDYIVGYKLFRSLITLASAVS